MDRKVHPPPTRSVVLWCIGPGVIPYAAPIPDARIPLMKASSSHPASNSRPPLGAAERRTRFPALPAFLLAIAIPAATTTTSSSAAAGASPGGRRADAPPASGVERSQRGVEDPGSSIGGAPGDSAPGDAGDARSGRDGRGSIAITRDAAQTRIVFAGILQSATDPGGPWTDVTPASSPFPVDPLRDVATARFYRSREAEGSGVFDGTSVIEWTLTGPLQKHFDLAFAGTPDGIFPPRREKPYFDGTLVMGAFRLPAWIRVRGNSSLQECPFPKLKVKLDGDDRRGTPFEDAREIRIATHCAEGGRGTVGRLREETATWREALAYEVLADLDFPAPRVRRAVIEYHDTSPDSPSEPGAWPVRRQALIFDDVELVAARFGAGVLSDEQVAALTRADFDEQALVDLAFLHALLGNWDYGLGDENRGFWNTEVIRLPTGSLVPLAGDFDLASWVTGSVRSSAPRDYHPDLPDVERQARFEVERLRGRAKPDAFDSARGRFERGRPQVEARIRNARIDDAGRTNALRHLTAFHEALAIAGR
jgi:hypothetical protein